MVLIKGLQLAIAGVQALFEVVLPQQRVVELHLGVLFDELVMNLVVTYAGAAGNQRLEFGQQKIVGDGVFKFSRRQIGPLQHFFVFLLANEVTAREKSAGVTTVLQFFLHILRADPQAHALGLADQSLAGNKLLGGAL